MGERHDLEDSFKSVTKKEDIYFHSTYDNH